MQRAFDEQQLETVCRIIHAVKGVAGNIGATRLNQKAFLLEKAISATDGYSAALGFFNQGFNALMFELNQFSHQESATKPTQAGISNTQLARHFSELYQLLKMGDTEALLFLEKIQSHLDAKSADKVNKLH